MARRILIIVAAGVVSLALCLFLALVLEWPKVVVYLVGMAPLFAAAVSVGSGGKGPEDGRR